MMNNDSILVSTKQTNKMMRNCTFRVKNGGCFLVLQNCCMICTSTVATAKFFSEMVLSKFYKDFR